MPDAVPVSDLKTCGYCQQPITTGEDFTYKWFRAESKMLAVHFYHLQGNKKKERISDN